MTAITNLPEVPNITTFAKLTAHEISSCAINFINFERISVVFRAFRNVAVRT